MATMKLSMQDKKDLDKFTKFLALKAAQIIVQSRSGEKVNTKCKPDSSGADWFNLAIQDIPDVLSEAKKVLYGELVSSTIPLCIEISLRTVEGDTLVLETWSLSVLPEQSDPAIRVTYTVYNRMGILLKSLVSVSRITPAYKLSRRQGPDSYGLCYRMYMGEPQLHTLGDNYKNVRVGQLSTPVGTIHLSLSYRTKMTISPTPNSRDSIMLKSDHFHSDLSPRHARYQQSGESVMNRKFRGGAFAGDYVLTEADMLIPDLSEGFSSMLPPMDPLSDLGAIYYGASEAAMLGTVPTTPPPSNAPAAMETTDSNTGDGEKLEEDNATPNHDMPNEDTPNDASRSSASMNSAVDDFMMLDVHVPFAIPTPIVELEAFYRLCKFAPPLKPRPEEEMVDVNELLDNLEATFNQTSAELEAMFEAAENTEQ